VGDSVSRSDKLDEKIAGSADIDALVKSSRRNRTVIKWLAASLIFDLLLTLGLGVLAVETYRQEVQANSIAARAHDSCVAANEGRAAQVQLWDYILALPPAAPPTPAQERQREQFRVYIGQTFAQRPC
jgi:hypothetical protein